MRMSHSARSGINDMDGNDVFSRQFITLEDVQVVLSISRSQAYALVRTGALRALQVGGRGQWRVELTELDAFIERCYQAVDAETADANAGTRSVLGSRVEDQ